MGYAYTAMQDLQTHWLTVKKASVLTIIPLQDKTSQKLIADIECGTEASSLLLARLLSSSKSGLLISFRNFWTCSKREMKE
ncbi:hypothetical protein HNR65_002578 [Desulfosalsimonas propionicica]|uniref:Uncharacterized protein n=1 Tax=Desulfosalsimonas propionicica TaxID=332175 RepID=A0A7W0CAN1_9BACT|nr:hypothetical protein [Desulfosalsimonas propionicica]MBA2882236.1 hypothetical protein [Desulfosalsimonas propionicica]